MPSRRTTLRTGGRTPGRQRAVAAALLAGLIVACLGPDARVQLAAPPVANHPCAPALSRTLEAWDARAEGFREADGPLGSTVVTLPTTHVGVWIVLRLLRDGSARTTRIGPQQSDHAIWTSGCTGPSRATTATELPGSGRAGAFTDRDLERTLRRVNRGVLYLWSPHMPLSVSGMRSLESATGQLGIALEPLLDPLADARYAMQTAAAEGLPPAALRPLASVELTFRDLTTHAPSIQVFADGRLVGGMLPGYRDPDYYRTFIERQLGAPPSAQPPPQTASKPSRTAGSSAHRSVTSARH